MILGIIVSLLLWAFISKIVDGLRELDAAERQQKQITHTAASQPQNPPVVNAPAAPQSQKQQVGASEKQPDGKEAIIATTDGFFAKKVTKEAAVALLTKESDNKDNTPATRSLALKNRAWIRSETGEIELARKDCQDALALNAKSVSTYQVLAAIDAKVRNFSSAKLNMEKALANYGKPNQEMTTSIVMLDGFANALDAVSLYKEFQNNSFAAEEKYKGKQIFITGKVVKISRTVDDKPELHIAAGSRKELACELFPNTGTVVAKLNEGDVVYMACALKKGGNAIVELTQCRVADY